MADAFSKLLDSAERGRSLGREGAREAMEFLVSGELSDAQIAAFLGAMSPQRVTAEELAGFAETMRDKGLTVEVRRRPVIDTCGTGGDGLGTFNFSTAAALIVAGAGVAVAKHGNRAVSSRSGSADVLEALGVVVDAAPEEVRLSIEEVGFGFCFAPRYHPAMKHVAAVRKALGVRTIFNLLGPLVNPACVLRQIVGLFEKSLLEKYAQTLLLLGAERVMVVHGDDGMDEISLCCATTICHGEKGRGVRIERVEPESLGLKRRSAKELAGQDAAGNARLMERLLEGAEGALAEATVLNAGAAMWVAGASGSLSDGIESARESVRSGKSRRILEKLRQRHRRKA